MCYKQSFAANSFLAGMKFAVHVYVLFCIYNYLMSLTGLLKIKHREYKYVHCC